MTVVNTTVPGKCDNNPELQRGRPDQAAYVSVDARPI